MLAIKYQSMGKALEFGFCWRLKSMPGFAISFRTQVKSTETICFSSHSSYMKPLVSLVAIKNTTSDQKKKRKIDFFQILPRLFSFFFAMKCSKSQWHHRKIQDSCNCPTTMNNQRPNTVLLLSVTSLMQSAFIILQVCKEQRLAWKKCKLQFTTMEFSSVPPFPLC